jgi:hypothetical protein
VIAQLLAQFDSKCPACHEAIVAESDEVVATGEGDWVHEDCA